MRMTIDPGTGSAHRRSPPSTLPIAGDAGNDTLDGGAGQDDLRGRDVVERAGASVEPANHDIYALVALVRAVLQRSSHGADDEASALMIVHASSPPCAGRAASSISNAFPIRWSCSIFHRTSASVAVARARMSEQSAA